MNTPLRHILAAAVFFMSFCTVAMAEVLPPPVFPYAIQYDDFFSYSAGILTELGIPGYDKGAAGTGNLDLLIYTGANGATNTFTVNGVNYAFQDPLDTPAGGATSFNTSFTNTWSAPVDSLLTYLQNVYNATTPVFTFDMNQTGSHPDLYASGYVMITDAQDNPVPGALWALDSLTNNAFDPSALVLAPGTITITYNGNTYTTNNNKGSGSLDFLMYAPTMDLTQYNMAGYKLVVNFQMQGLSDGFEELFLTGAYQPSIPEPGTMLLMGVGAVGVAIIRSRKGKATRS